MVSEQIFKPSNALTFDTVQPDGKRLQKLLRDNKTTTICMDLGEVVHCDSAGLALFIEAKRLCNQHQKTLKIEAVPKVISALAEFCGVEKMLEPSRVE
jgi:phospholipid transport system transporter-binding protein